jgi:hypothetical protein
VSADCGGSGSENLVYVPAKVVGAYSAVRAGQPSATLSCADVPGTQDYVLTVSDVSTLETQLVAMNTHIRGIAAENGFAFFDLEPLYGQRGLKAPFSATTLLTSDEPFGPFISLDGSIRVRQATISSLAKPQGVELTYLAISRGG